MKPISTREAFGEEIIALATANPDVWVIDCDISKSCKTTGFAKQFPQRHINVGIAEQNAAGVAAGLATMGKIPFVSTYAVFGSLRMAEQVRTSVCYPRLNVKLACSHGGLTPGNDGPTHQAIEDMGVYRSVPNMTVIMPADYWAARRLIAKAVTLDGPVYIRLTRDALPQFYNETEEFFIGKAKLIQDGKDISLYAIGDMLHQAVIAAEELAKRGFSVEMVDVHTLKPFDEESVRQSLAKTGRIITIEDHNILNGLGSAVAEVVAETGKGGILKRIGLKDCFAESGQYKELLTKYHMDAAYIVNTAENLLCCGGGDR